MPILANIYYSYITVGVAFLVYTYVHYLSLPPFHTILTCMHHSYTYLPPRIYRTIRRTLATNNALAFLLLSTTRVTPPRLLPPFYGYVDTLYHSADSGSAWTHNRFQLTIAAMPSLHFGTALFLAAYLARFAPHRWLRCVA